MNSVRLYPLELFDLACRPLYGHNLRQIKLLSSLYDRLRYWATPKSVVVKAGDCKLLVNRRMGGIGATIIKDGIWEPETTSLFAEFAQRGRGAIVDVGANIGYYSLLAGKLLQESYDTVYAFEPERENYAAIIKGLKLNSLANVRVFPVAVSDQAGSTKLYVSPSESGAHNIVGSHNLKESYPVATETIDNVLKYVPVRLIKIDTEGAEIKVLHGARHVLTEQHPTLIVECWEEGLQKTGDSIEEMLGLLHHYGYQSMVIDEFQKTSYPATIQTVKAYHVQHGQGVNLFAS